MMVTRRFALAAGLLASLWGCGNKAAKAPNPTAYLWPDTVSYRVDFVSETQRNQQSMLRYASSKTMRLANRGGQYIGVFDSVFKTSQRPNQPLVLVPFLPEDTLSFFVKLSAHGK